MNTFPSYSRHRPAVYCRNLDYTRLLRKALDVLWQLHMTNKELYGMIPSAMDQLRQRRLSFAGHCYRCEDQPVKQWRN